MEYGLGIWFTLRTNNCLSRHKTFQKNVSSWRFFKDYKSVTLFLCIVPTKGNFVML